MTPISPQSRRASKIALASCLMAWGGALASPANAQDLSGQVAVRVGGQVATNPYLEEGDQGTSVAGTAEIRPRLSYDDSVTRLEVEAFASGTAYAQHYGFEDNYGASAAVSHRVSERLRLLFNASIQSAKSLLNGSLWSTAVPGSAPGEPPLPQLPGDVTVFGQRGRTTSADLRAGFEYTIDAHNRLSFDANYGKTLLDYAGASDHEQLGGEGRYDRVLNERMTIGLIAGYRVFNYDDPLLADARAASLLGSFSLRLDPVWTLTGAAGVERTHTDDTATDPASNHTALTARASLCRRQDRARFCVDYSRQAEASGYAGVRNTDALGLSYSEQVSEYDIVTLGGSYSRSAAFESDAITIPAATNYSGRVGLEHRFNERLSGYVEGSVDKLHRSDISIDPSVRVGAGISYVFGRGR